MTFRAASGDHAIIEVVFGLVLTRPWRQSEIAKLTGAHARWRALLPQMTPTQTHEIMFGPAGFAGRPAQTNGVSFQSYQPDGQIAWRMLCEQNGLVINCLRYTGWDETWPAARDLIRQAVDAGSERGDQAIQAVTLQYVDKFDWNAAVEGYSTEDLLNMDSPYIPDFLRASGPEWHTHLGWFSPQDHPTPGRILNQVNLTGTVDPEATVRLDVTLRKDLVQHQSMLVALQEGTVLDQMFDNLHEANKSLVRQLLQRQMLVDIGLEDVQGG